MTAAGFTGAGSGSGYGRGNDSGADAAGRNEAGSWADEQAGLNPEGGRFLSADRQADGAFDASGQEVLLPLDDRDEPLPWLETDDEEPAPVHDTGRLLMVGLLGLIAVGAVLAAVWQFTRERPDPSLVADGSLVEAPTGPWRERPDNPGGTQVAGTGDASFAVAQGKAPEGVIANDAPPPPVLAVEQADAIGLASPAENSGPAGSVGVQVGAYSTREAAQAGWNQLVNRYPPLQGRSHRIVEGTADSGTIFRLQALAPGGAEADSLCRALRAAGGDCQVKR